MRTEKKIAAAACAAIALATSSARADDAQVLDTNHRVGGSPQNFAIEIRGALYQARVDDDPTLNGATPYASAFGTSPRIEVGVELDWQVLHIPFLGSLGPGVGVGYTSMNGSTTFLPGAAVNGGHVSGEQTSLDIYPFYAVAVLRIDTFDRNAHIPLIPYAKAGIGYALWRASNTGGTSVAADGTAGKGHTVGTQLAAGLDFDLNLLDPHAARELDNSTGINHTYLFAEYMISDLTGLGQTHALYVGTRSPVFGLAFDF